MLETTFICDFCMGRQPEEPGSALRLCQLSSAKYLLTDKGLEIIPDTEGHYHICTECFTTYGAWAEKQILKAKLIEKG